jgi:hypothetical protein
VLYAVRRHRTRGRTLRCSNQLNAFVQAP